ncbi:MAG: tetratricopeptide repeat protein [Chloroflexota bacterium]
MIRFELFGYPTVWQDGKQVTGFISEKAMALLIFFVVSQKTHSRDYLTGLLWGNSADGKAKASLRSALYNLGQLFPGFLEVSRKTAAVHPAASYQLDIDQFRKNQNAALHTAEYLAGFYISDAPEFEEWLLREREQLRAQAIAIWQKNTEINQNDEAKHVAFDALRKLEPWREEVYQRQMALFARAGNYTAALDIFQQCEQALAHELDISPSPETEQLVNRIRLAQSLPRHNLPAQTAPFFGREQLISKVKTALKEHRLISLVGLGGSGKTSLAHAIGRQCATYFMHGVGFVSLEQVKASEPSSIPAAIVQALVQVDMLPPSREADTVHLLNQMPQRNMLLILDNFEHLIQSAQIINQLLSTAPELHILITSRQRLQHPQEQVFHVDGLSHEASAALFTSIAHRVQPSFVADQATLDICKLVDGLPLGVELAASWADVQPPEEILSDLRSSLNILQDETSHRPERHQSIRAIFEQAWQHLSTAQQKILVELTLLNGGFTSKAAKLIAGASTADLRALKNRALIYTVDHRFDLHPLLKQFLQTKGSPQKKSEFAAFYLSHFSKVGETNNLTKIRALTSDYENFAQAWRWAADHSPKLLLSPAGYLHILFSDRGLDEWSNKLVEYALSTVPNGLKMTQLTVRLKLEKVYYLFWQAKQPENAVAVLSEIEQSQPNWGAWQTENAYFHTLSGWIRHYYFKDPILAKNHYQQAADIWQTLNNQNQLASRLLDLGNVAFEQKEYEAAEQHWNNCALAAQSVDNQIAYACAEFSLGRLASAKHDFKSAKDRLALAQPHLNKHYGLHSEWLTLQGKLHIWLEEFDQAEASFLKQLEVCQIYGRIDHTIAAYCNLGRLCLLKGEPNRAATYFSKAEFIASDAKLPEYIEQISRYKNRPQFTADES